jgi:hypothetical protein
VKLTNTCLSFLLLYSRQDPRVYFDPLHERTGGARRPGQPYQVSNLPFQYVWCVITGPLTIVFCFVLLRFVAQAWKDPQNITDQLSPKPEKPQ